MDDSEEHRQQEDTDEDEQQRFGVNIGTKYGFQNWKRQRNFEFSEK